MILHNKVHATAHVPVMQTMRSDKNLVLALTVTGLSAACVQSFVAPGTVWRTTGYQQHVLQQRQHLLRGDRCCSPNRHRRKMPTVSICRPRTTSMSIRVGNGCDSEDSIDPSASTMWPAEGIEQGGVEGEKDSRSERRWAALTRSLRRGAASLAALMLGTTTLSGISTEVQKKVGYRLPGPVAMARASVFKPFSKRTVEEKLGNLPAFMVTNYKGSPYLAPAEEQGVQMAIFFTNLDDAQSMLQEMVQNPYYTTNARVLVLSMEKAYGMVKGGAKGTGYVNSDGREEFMSFKFEQDTSSLEKALRLGLALEPSALGVDIPLFFAEGLEVKKEGSTVRPLFMDPADLVSAWQKASERNPDMPKKPPVKVYSFAEVIVEMETSDEFKDFGFFPSSEARQYISKGRAMKARPRSRLGRLQSF